MTETTIHHVSDTALWVAYFRALEGEQPKPLFVDPFAKRLVGDKGKKIAESMKVASRYARWSVVIRTIIIDRYIQNFVAQGGDMVINLGAGLDARPYRMKLPSSLRWVEVDYPSMIEYKENILKDEKPVVQLERISLDLAERDKRQALFSKLGSESKKILVLTEGVLPYLTEAQVSELAEDLLAQKSFRFWVAEYFSAQVYKYLQNEKRTQQMRNAPFKFFPPDWFAFFDSHGWKASEVSYMPEEAMKVGRKFPIPWWALVFIPFMDKERKKSFRTQTGFVVFTPKGS